MSKSSKRKTYKRLCQEREALLDEAESWKQGNLLYSRKQRMGLWKGSRYLDELLYIRQRVEKDMIPQEIVYRMKLYIHLMNKIPERYRPTYCIFW